MRNIIIALVILAALIGGYWLFSKPRANTSEEEAQKAADAYLAQVSPDSQAAAVSSASSSAQVTISTSTEESTSATKKYMNATLHTNKGDITIELLEKDAPLTVSNFRKLAEEKFYDGVKFHRVIKGFMIQGGDPLTKDDSMQARWGTGGPGYTFADELRPNNKNDIGTIAMANAGPNTNGSQFFINVANNNFLDGKHTVFGKVVKGMEIVEAIANAKTDINDRPEAPIIIQSITLQ